MADDIVGKYIKQPSDRDSGNATAGNAESGNGGDPHTPIESGCLISLPGSMAVMLDLRFKDGTRSAIPYGYITDLDFNPQTGIVLATAAKTVTITGRGLLPVYNSITTQTALAVSESPTGFDEGGGDPFVETIAVTVIGNADATTDG